MSYTTKVYKTNGSDKIVVEEGGDIEIAGVPRTIAFTPAAGAANVAEVAMAVKDVNGNTIAGVFQFDVWLSDATTGAGHTGTSASGTVQAKSASGVDVQVNVAKKALRVQTLATGIYTLQITDTAKTAFKVCAQVPGTGATVLTTLATADYGA